MIDPSGYRPNVGIILANHTGQIFWAKRVGRDAWQFPQGGMNQDETPEDTLFRELKEEIGLNETDVTLVARTRHWLRYRLPPRLIRDTQPKCIGQKQLWYLLRLESGDDCIHLDATLKPEFDEWRWVSYFYPLRQVVLFKREVYRKALRELAPYLFENLQNLSRRGAHPLNYLLEN